MEADVRVPVGVSKRLIARAGSASLAAFLVACSGDQPAPVPDPTAAATPIVEASSATPAPTAAPSPTAITTATPTPSASGAQAPAPNAATPAIAAAAGKAYFPPPAPRASAPPPNSVGIARLLAPPLGLDHYVEVDGIIDGQMESPRDGSYAVGFYPDFAHPGTGGNAVFSAHETWNHFQGPFYQMAAAKAGDEVAVVMADGRQLRYRVFSNTRYQVDTMPMAEILWPSSRPSSEEWLTLLTCGGRIVYDNSGFGEYLDRDVVVARRIS